MSAPLRFFAPCPRGLEDALSSELTTIGAGAVRTTPGGVHFTGELRDAYRANLHSRLASRVLLQIAHGPYKTDEDVYRLAHQQPWGEWFSVEQTIRVDVSATKSPLRSLEFVTLRIKDAVCDHLRAATGHRPSVDTRAPDVRIYAYLDAQRCTLYLDTSGEALFKRGWRSAVGDAPLRENLAAGVLSLAGWQPGRPLLDPMCGSGSFIVEAAQMCLGIAPGVQRAFAFEKLRNFDASAWAELRDAAQAAPVVDELLLSASDVAGDAIVQTRANLLRAGVSEAILDTISLKQIDARHIRPHAAGGLLVTNPPYGERVAVRGAADPTHFFAEFGDTLKQRFAGWQCSILTSDLAFQKKLRLSPSRRTPLFNGALECRLYRFELVQGSARGTNLALPKDSS